MAARRKPRVAAHRAPADEHAATELVMFIENESDLSPDGPSGQGRSTLLNMLRKWKAGTYNPTLAVKQFEYLTEAGAKRYAKEFATEREWSTMFTPATRHEAAKQLEASFRSSAEQGEYDHIDVRRGAHEPRQARVAAKGIYKDMTSFSPKDYVIHYREDRQTWSVDRIGSGGTHTTIGSTRGYGTMEQVRKAIEYDAHVQAVSSAQIHDASGQLMGELRGGRAYFYPGSWAIYPYRFREGREAILNAAGVADRKQSMTYGTLPSFEEFLHDVHTRIDPETDEPYWPEGTTYPMELVSSREIGLAQDFGGLDSFSGRYAHKAGFRGDERQIYDFLVFLIDRWDEQGFDDDGEGPGDLASSIMYTLGYEWI